MPFFWLILPRSLPDAVASSYGDDMCGVQVGGMGDVVTALARAVQDEGHEVEVLLPKYDIINYAEVSIPAVHNLMQTCPDRLQLRTS